MLRASSVVLLCYTIDLSRTGYLEELVPRRVSRKYGQRNEEVNMILHKTTKKAQKSVITRLLLFCFLNYCGAVSIPGYCTRTVTSLCPENSSFLAKRLWNIM